MQSVRLNKAGKEIPSVKDPWDAYKQQGYQYTPPVQRSMHPYACESEYGLIGGCEVPDPDWEEYNRLRAERRNASVLSATTSLGEEIPARGQDDLNRFLVQNSRWATGDFVTFATYPTDSLIVSIHSLSFILATERLFEKVNWPAKESAPKPYLLLNLSPSTQKKGAVNPYPPSARWSHLLNSRHIAAGEFHRLIKDNDQLSDYIEQAKTALKAGTLKIDG